MILSGLSFYKKKKKNGDLKTTIHCQQVGEKVDEINK